MKRRGLVLAVVAVAAVMLSGCGITSTDAPITLRSDKRLKMVSPGDEEKVTLPVTVKWAVTDFPIANGNHFGLFVDRAPLGAGKELRWRICGEQEKQPVQPGEDRRPCKDDRKTIFVSARPPPPFQCVDTN